MIYMMICNPTHAWACLPSTKTPRIRKSVGPLTRVRHTYVVGTERMCPCSPPVCLSVYLSTCLSLYLSVCQSFSVCLSLSCLCLSLSPRLQTSPTVITIISCCHFLHCILIYTWKYYFFCRVFIVCFGHTYIYIYI